MSKIEVIHGDCLEVMKTMEDNSVDLILTDIPYGECDVDNNGIRDKHTKKSDLHTADSALFGLSELCRQIDRLVKKGAYIFCGIKQISSITEYFSKYTTRLIIREKTNPMPINGTYVFLSGIESCVWFKKPNGTHNAHCKNTVFRNEIETGSLHPTQKPIHLFRQFLDISSNKGDKVLDPFAGSGTTGVACKELGRDCILIEKEKKYVDIIHKRLAHTTTSLFH